MKSNNVKSISKKARENHVEGLSDREDVMQWWNKSIAYGIHTQDVEPLSYILPMYSSGTFMRENGRMAIEIVYHAFISYRGEWRKNTRRISNERMFEYESFDEEYY